MCHAFNKHSPGIGSAGPRRGRIASECLQLRETTKLCGQRLQHEITLKLASWQSNRKQKFRLCVKHHRIVLTAACSRLYEAAHRIRVSQKLGKWQRTAWSAAGVRSSCKRRHWPWQVLACCTYMFCASSHRRFDYVHHELGESSLFLNGNGVRLVDYIDDEFYGRAELACLGPCTAMCTLGPRPRHEDTENLTHGHQGPGQYAITSPALRRGMASKSADGAYQARRRPLSIR